MACMRSISRRADLNPRRFHPSFGHVLLNDKDDTKSAPPSIPGVFPRGSSCSGMDSLGSLFRERQLSSFARPVGFGFSFCRYMSTTPGEWSDKVEGIGFIAEEVIPEEVVEAVGTQLPAINEVAVAAADSAFPVAALQYLIDGVHSFTGLNWWASIALTTLLIRGFTIPLLISQLKATMKLNMLRPRLEEIRQEISGKATDPEAMAEGQKRMKALFNEYGVTPFTPLKGLLIQGPIFISFFFAIRNMAEKVPSFKTGGTLWFTDLTTPDSLYILPVLTALTFWITVECNMQEGLEGNPVAGTMKNFSRILAVVAVPVMMSFPKALFCYWVTSNLFSLCYGLVIRRPEIKKLLNLPVVSVSPTDASQARSASFSALNNDTAIQLKSPLSPEAPKAGARRILDNDSAGQARSALSSEPSEAGERRRISRASVLSQRLKALEKQVKNRKRKNK